MFDFLWYKKERLNEQLKFFGAKRFRSVYAKKPRIRITSEQESNTDVMYSTGWTQKGLEKYKKMIGKPISSGSCLSFARSTQLNHLKIVDGCVILPAIDVPRPSIPTMHTVHSGGENVFFKNCEDWIPTWQGAEQ